MACSTSMMHRIDRRLLIEELEPRIAPTWTMMVYLDGDNNLEGPGIDDFLEMSSIGSTGDVNIVVQMDRISGGDTRYGNWTGTRRGLVDLGDVPDSSWGASVGEVNMADPATLTSFATWAMGAYPADNYGLILWDHGGGFDGVCWDDSSGDDCLTMEDLTTALSGIGPLDLLGFDACLMGMTEIAYQVQTEAGVMVASEETEPGDGWEYQNFLNYLAADPSMTAGALADRIIDAYAAHYNSSGDCTLSSIDLAQMGSAVSGLAGSIESFSNLMLSTATTSDWSAVRTARNAAQSYAYSTYRDLGHFMTLVENSGAAEAIRLAAADVNTALGSAVLRAYAGSYITGTGLSIYLPGLGDAMSSAYDSTIQFVADTHWDEFLSSLITLGADAYEADNTPAQAKAITTDGVQQTHSIHVGSDIDWVTFSLAGTSDVTIQTNGTSGDTRMWLYGPNSSSTLIEYDDDDGDGAFSRIVRSGGNALAAGTYYVKVDEYGNNDTIASYTISVLAGSGGSDAYEVDNTSSQASVISTDGSPQTHSIHTTTDVDWVKFTLTAPSDVTIETSGASGDTQMWLYGPNSATTLIEYDDDDGDGYFSRIVRTGANSLGAGTYYVKVDEYGHDSTISSYTIRVMATGGGGGEADAYEMDDTPDQASVISTSGVEQTHSIHVRTDVDWVKFTLAETSDVTITTNGAAGDTQMWLYGPDSSSTLIEYDDDDGAEYFAQIVRSGANALGPGTYYVKVDEFGNNATIAEYTLSVLATTGGGTAGDVYEVDDTAGQAKTISTNGAAQTHSIHVNTDVDWVRFTLTSTSNVTIATDGASGDTRMWLYGPNSSTALIEYDDDDGNGLFSKIARLGADALPAGTYYVKVEEYGNDATIDNYTISVTATAFSPLVLSARNPVARFHDADNDYVQLVFRGPGEAWVTTTNGLSPLVDPNQDIGYVGFLVTTGASSFLMQDLDPAGGSPNTLTAGTVETQGIEFMGTVRFLASRGTVSNTSVDIAGDLTMFYVLGAASNVDLTVGGSLTQQITVGNSTNCDTSVTGSLTVFRTTGSVTNANLSTGGDALQVMATGNVSDSTVNIGGTSTAVRILGAVDNSTVDIAGDVRIMQFIRTMTGTTVEVGGLTTILQSLNGQTGSTLDLNGGARQILLFGGMNGTALTVTGDVTNIIVNGAMENTSSVHVTGATNLFRVTRGIKTTSTVELNGDVRMACLYGLPGEASVSAGSTVTLGNLTAVLTASGAMAGTIDITGSAAPDGRNSNIRIIGDLSGSLLANVFGNVMIVGEFSGQIGDAGTADGAGNRLQVASPGGGGTLLPSDGIFATRIGYP